MRQPVFGRGVNPGLGLADFSGIERGGAAMGSGMAMGLASLGAGMEKGRAERQQMERQVRSAEATLKALGKRENLDDGLRDIATGLLDAISDPNSPLRDRAATAGTANQSIDQFLKLGAFEMEKKQAEEQSQMRQMQMLQAQQDQAKGQWNMEQERRVLKQLEQNQQGIGSGVLRPEVTARLSEINRLNPQAAFAAQQGVSLDAAGRFVSPSASENQLTFTTDDESGQRFATWGNNLQQINALSAEQLTKFERELEAVDRQRTAAGMPPLTPEQRVEAIQIYVSRQAQGTPSTNLMQNMTNEIFRRNYPEIESTPRDMFGVKANTGSSEGTPLALPDPAAARKSVNNRLFGR